MNTLLQIYQSDLCDLINKCTNLDTLQLLLNILVKMEEATKCD